jgi:alginate O-acetyltransferase complex protein AlgI
VIWGAYHGLLLVGYHLTRQTWDRMPALARRALTFGLVVVGWVLFRATDLGMAADLLATMFSWSPGTLPVGVQLLVPMLAIAGLIAHAGRNLWELTHRWRPAMAFALTALFALCLVLIWGGQRMPFLYFQF